MKGRRVWRRRQAGCRLERGRATTSRRKIPTARAADKLKQGSHRAPYGRATERRWPTLAKTPMSVCNLGHGDLSRSMRQTSTYRVLSKPDILPKAGCSDPECDPAAPLPPSGGRSDSGQAADTKASNGNSASGCDSADTWTLGCARQHHFLALSHTRASQQVRLCPGVPMEPRHFDVQMPSLDIGCQTTRIDGEHPILIRRLD